MPPRLPSIRPTTRRERIYRNRELKDRDNLFRNGKGPEKFEFNEQVASVFDDMLDRSVPLYNECRNLTIAWCQHLARPQSCVYDLGCSTGTLLAQLAGALPEISGLRLIGVDNSKPMLDKAREKLTDLPYPVDLIEADLHGGFSLNRACTVVMNYTLQFIPPEKRLALVKKIFHGLDSGGGLILIEKVLSEDTQLNKVFIEMHHDLKHDQGYSSLEIAKKRDALENVLIPWKLTQTTQMLHESGFNAVDVFFKWNNFAGLVALK
ncbi:MAG: carboxy-S-adenosyl-L-methionine synthase CmoA [Nitrospinaceae bacterium]|nr:carboxy-S-adenosyl-L-methionine synthase CmoA [Nitrospinaceae bacterium]